MRFLAKWLCRISCHSYATTGRKTGDFFEVECVECGSRAITFWGGTSYLPMSPLWDRQLLEAEAAEGDEEDEEFEQEEAEEAEAPQVAELNRRLIERTAAYEARERAFLEEIRRLKAVAGATGVEAQVCADIAARQRVGIAKYGTTLEGNPAGRVERIRHAYEEALDLPIYLRWELDKAVAETLAEGGPQ